MKSEAVAMQVSDFLASLSEEPFKIHGAVAYDDENKKLLFSPNSEVYPYIEVPMTQVASVTPFRNSSLLSNGGWKRVSFASLQFVDASTEEAKFFQEVLKSTLMHISEYLAKTQAPSSSSGCNCGGGDEGGEAKIMASCGCPHACLGACVWDQCYGTCV